MTTPAQDIDTRSRASREPMFQVDRELLERLMKRIKTAESVSVRELADLAGVAHGTVGNLLTGETEKVYGSTASALCEAIGVELFILFTPVFRLARPRQPQEVTAA